MRWGGFVGEGTPLADETRTLLRQKILRQLSFGWEPRSPRRWVSAKDKDLDPHYAKELEASGVTEALAFDDWEPYEGSIVDLADDRQARLAAALGLSGPGAADSQSVRDAVLEALGEEFSQFLADFKDAVLEALANDAAVIGAARAFREDLRAARAEATTMPPDELAGDGHCAALIERLRQLS
jgi:hypothetical protein